MRFPTPGVNIFLGWNVADPHVLATVSDSNVVTFLDMRKGKYLRTVKNRQEVRSPHGSQGVTCCTQAYLMLEPWSSILSSAYMSAHHGMLLCGRVSGETL